MDKAYAMAPRKPACHTCVIVATDTFFRRQQFRVPITANTWLLAEKDMDAKREHKVGVERKGGGASQELRTDQHELKEKKIGATQAS